MLHVFLILRRLKDDDERCKAMGQAVFDVMFSDLDENLREMGVGDIGVSYRIKDMVEAFYGRIAIYEKGLGEPSTKTLEVALGRNLYRGARIETFLVVTMAEYVRGQDKELAIQTCDSFLAGRVEFSLPPTIGEVP